MLVLVKCLGEICMRGFPVVLEGKQTFNLGAGIHSKKNYVQGSLILRKIKPLFRGQRKTGDELHQHGIVGTNRRTTSVASLLQRFSFSFPCGMLPVLF